jgi:hypothetical protein
MDTPRLITIDEVINSLANRMDDYSMDNYQRYLEIALDGIRLHRFFYTKTIKVKSVTLSALDTIDFESDWLKVVNVAIPYNGRYYTFTYDSQLLEPTDVLDGLPAQGTGEANQIVTDSVTRPGATGGNDFYCRVDNEAGKIYVNGYAGDTVYVRYISSGVSLDGITYVPAESKDALMNYIYYQSIAYLDVPQTKIERAHDLYKTAIHQLQMIHSPSLEQIIDAYYQGIAGTVRR